MLNMCVNEARIVTCIVNYTRTDGGGGGANIIYLELLGIIRLFQNMQMFSLIKSY